MPPFFLLKIIELALFRHYHIRTCVSNKLLLIRNPEQICLSRIEQKLISFRKILNVTMRF